MSLSRRLFLARAAQAAVAAPGLAALAACAHGQAEAALIPDAAGGLLDLPDGFSYAILSKAGDRMSDGLFEPKSHDGMASFAIPGDPARCVLVRNHEIRPGDDDGGAFGADHVLARELDPALIYDRTPGGRPLLGGTTSLIVNVAEARVERSWLSLAGTGTNCAGGMTPWASWLTCEETEEAPGDNAERFHGFVFEVPSQARNLVPATPLTAMGRFRHEACAVDAATGIVYLTEDQGDGLFYRFIPNTPGRLVEGGRLQALALADKVSADTRNWTAAEQVSEGRKLPVRWIDLEEVHAPKADLRQRGHAAGAAVFARGEGLAFAAERGGSSVYFACTNGGAAKRGQIWRLEPRGNGDTLELFAESRAESAFDMVDNIVVAPWGDIILCEDGDGDNFVKGLTPAGDIYTIARNAHPAQSEFCGACFSPDGSTLFVNVQNPGHTYAIKGPWSRLRRRA